jgi:hypothetical protein
MGSSRTVCDRVCRALWPDPDRAWGPAARAHYQTCRVCRQFFIRDRRLAVRVASVARPAASAELRARIAVDLLLH